MSDLKSPRLPQPLGTLPADTPRSVFLTFCVLLEQELVYRKQKGLDPGKLLGYYNNLFDSQGRSLPVGINGYGQRLFPALREMFLPPRPRRILDAGSGYGTESYLFSLLGHSVTGVELVGERAELAKSRLDFFASRCDFVPEIEFVNAHILRFLEKTPRFDIIWAMEAVSHIYPQEEFFRISFDRLNPGGTLIVSDPNRLNPLAWLRAVKIRGSIRHEPHQRFEDPETGIPTDYGQEQIYTLLGVKKELRRAGFHLKCLDVSGFMGSSLLPAPVLRGSGTSSLLRAWQIVCRALPGIRRLGSIYTIVAEKQ
jgi:SAM-dependent methyltransferase